MEQADAKPTLAFDLESSFDQEGDLGVSSSAPLTIFRNDNGSDGDSTAKNTRSGSNTTDSLDEADLKPEHSNHCHSGSCYSHERKLGYSPSNAIEESSDSSAISTHNIERGKASGDIIALTEMKTSRENTDPSKRNGSRAAVAKGGTLVDSNLCTDNLATPVDESCKLKENILKIEKEPCSLFTENDELQRRSEQQPQGFFLHTQPANGTEVVLAKILEPVGQSIARKTQSLQEKGASLIPRPSSCIKHHPLEPLPKDFSACGPKTPSPETHPGRGPGSLMTSHFVMRNNTHVSPRASDVFSSRGDSAPRCPALGDPLPGPKNHAPCSVRTLRRVSSLSDTSSMCSGSGVPEPSKETLTSKLRYDRNHQDHMQGVRDPYSYLTPSQRKDALVRDLKMQVRDLKRMLDEKDYEIEEWQLVHEAEKEEIRNSLLRDLQHERESTAAAKEEANSLRESTEESARMIADLHKHIEELEKLITERQKETERIYLEMYNKGRRSATFEREEELEMMTKAVKGSKSVNATMTDLRNKLLRTQAELAKWQTLRRSEAYQAATLPATEAETTLRFLKDSMFHFLTGSGSIADDHLRAIVRILRFSDVQKEKIAKAIIEKRNKSAIGFS